MNEPFVMPVCVLPGSSILPASLPEREAFGQALSHLLPDARGVSFDMELISPESLGQPPAGTAAESRLHDEGALRFLVLHAEGDVAPRPPEPLEPLEALRTMEICGQLSFAVNQAFGEGGVHCKVRVYPPVLQSQALAFGALRHAAAAVFERVKQVARESGASVGDIGVRLRYEPQRQRVAVQLLTQDRELAALMAVPVVQTEGGLEASVEAAASALAAAGVEIVDCDQASREPFARYVQERGKALTVLPSSIRKLMTGRTGPH